MRVLTHASEPEESSNSKITRLTRLLLDIKDPCGGTGSDWGAVDGVFLQRRLCGHSRLAGRQRAAVQRIRDGGVSEECGYGLRTSPAGCERPHFSGRFLFCCRDAVIASLLITPRPVVLLIPSPQPRPSRSFILAVPPCYSSSFILHRVCS